MAVSLNLPDVKWVYIYICFTVPAPTYEGGALPKDWLIAIIAGGATILVVLLVVTVVCCKLRRKKLIHQHYIVYLSLSNY